MNQDVADNLAAARIVRAAMEQPDLTTTEATACDDWVFDLLDVVERAAPLLLEHGAEALGRLVRERCGDDSQTRKEACEAVRLWGRMAGEFRGRYGAAGKPVRKPQTGRLEDAEYRA